MPASSVPLVGIRTVQSTKKPDASRGCVRLDHRVGLAAFALVLRLLLALAGLRTRSVVLRRGLMLRRGRRARPLGLGVVGHRDVLWRAQSARRRVLHRGLHSVVGSCGLSVVLADGVVGCIPGIACLWRTRNRVCRRGRLIRVRDRSLRAGRGRTTCLRRARNGASRNVCWRRRSCWSSRL